MKLPIKYSESDWKTRQKARDEYYKIQGGLCWFCHKSLHSSPSSEVLSYKINKSLFPPKMFDYPIHLHHDHETDLTIGAVHAICNAYLWQYKGQ